MAPDDKYPDSYGMQLTDGIMSSRTEVGYSDTHYAGYWTNGEITLVMITVDLGAVTPETYRFEADCMYNKSAGVYPPSSVTVEYSSDGKKWNSAGEMTRPQFDENTANTFTLELKNRVSCRYVRFTFNKAGAWIFIDEISVYAIGRINGEGSAYEVINNLYASEKITDSSLKKALDTVKTGTPDKNQYRCDILSGKSYTANVKPETAFPDTDKQLTDLLTGEDLDGSSWVGFEGGKDIEITVPLGETLKNIAAFELHAFSSGKGNIEFPRCVTFSVSKDGKTWTQIARSYAPKGAQNVYTFTAELPCTISAKYIKYTLNTEGCRLVLVDEIAAFAYDDMLNDEEVYPPLKFPENAQTYWDPSEPQYGLIKDLIKGQLSQISYVAGQGAAAKDKNTPVTSPVLTDGAYASDLDIHGGKYFKFNGSGKRFIFFDLQHISTVYSVKMSQLNVTSWAIYAPGKVPVLVSEDAVNWYSAGEITFNTAQDHTKLSVKYSFDTPIAARFVCFCVDVDGWAGIDELEVNGTKAIASNAIRISSGALKKYDDPEWIAEDSGDWGEYDDTLGAKDVYLAYHGQKRHPSVDDLMPIMGHLGTNGKYDDTMFDGALFLMSGQFPGNLGGGTGGVLDYNKSDAEWLLEQLFDPSQNIKALETAVGKLKTTLKLGSDYKVKYYVSLYYPRCENFGDIDGDGVSEDLSTAEGKIKVLNWWIDKFESERAKCSFKNIEFGGYYWYNESMKSGDEVITNAVAKKIHSYGSILFWIPYFTANGWTDWQKYGFDTVCLQPNYAFHTDIPASRIPAAASVARKGKMSLEIEMDHRVSIDSRYKMRYYEYLKQGFKLGYQEHCPHLYYIGASLQSYAKSTDPAQRQIYDYTYGFIKGTLKLAPDKPANKSVSGKAGTPVTGKVAVNSNVEPLFKIVDYPAHGTVTLEADGSYTYYPNKGYTGKDSFSVAYSEWLDYSKPCVISITIK
ncbi:MAG: DUF4855 domain-containing protein [Clostridia bacterium]|nr:DUF4855 domain-containing protein [Clostridia bacterium]